MMSLPRVSFAARRPIAALALILLVAVAVRIALAPLYAYLPNGYLDEGFWKYWMQRIHEHGVLNIFRTSDTDYIGYHWVLWLLSMAYAAIGGPYTQTTPSLHLLVKVPSIVFDLALIVAVYAATLTLARQSRLESAARTAALAAAAVVAFHPVVLYDSAVWAQLDGAVTAAMLASVLLVATGRPGTGWAVWMLGFLIKPHPVIIVPVLLVLTVRRHGVRALVRSALAVAGVAAIVLGPWLLHGDAANIATTYKALFDANYERLSASAWNLWWFRDVAAHPGPDEAMFGAAPMLTYRHVGLALSAAAGALATVYVWRRPTLRDGLLTASYLALAFYVLPVSTHERYMYPLVALLLPIAALEPRWRWPYAIASTTLFLNMVVAAPPVASLSGRWIESPFSLAVAAVNVALFAWFTGVLVRPLIGQRSAETPARAERQERWGEPLAPVPAGEPDAVASGLPSRLQN